jgi:hypothetical protein
MLCDPVLYADNSPVLVEALLEQGALSLHYVETNKDVPDIFELLKKEARQNWQVEGLLDKFKESFSYIAGSSSSQAFVLHFGEKALFEIEVHEARRHFDLRDDFTLEDGDYFIQVFAGDFDLAEYPIYIQGLRLCLDYFWKFSEVKRIIAPVYTGSREEQQADLFRKAGLTTSLKKNDSKQPDLHLLSRPA